MQNNSLVGFISLIVAAHIHKVMLEKGLYKKMTMKKLPMTLSKLCVQVVNGTRILFPLTNVQELIYKAYK